MKILLALSRPLFPADTGGKIRSLNMFRRLAQRVKIHAISPADPVPDAAAISEMEEIFDSYTPIYRREARSHSLRFYSELCVNQFSRLPYSLSKNDLPQFRSMLPLLAQRERVDLILCDFLHTAFAALECNIMPRVVLEHNVEFVLRKRQWATERNYLRKHIFAGEWRKTHAVEAEVCRSFDHVITVSEEDQETIKHEFGINRVSSIPTGVDADFYRPLDLSTRPGSLVFIGSMDWLPNEDAMMWFLRDIYPRIRNAVPHTSLSIVGRKPSRRLCEAASWEPGVEVTSWVPDTRPYVAQAEVAVVPLRIGGGTRIKIPEAMAMAKPVVSTRIGAEGLRLRDGEEICLADQPDEFADAVIELLNDSSHRKAMGRAGREKVIREHSWETVVDKLEHILDSVRRLPQPGSTLATTAGFEAVGGIS